MQAFYKKALLALISLVLADALLAAIGIPLSYLSLSVLAPQPTGRPSDQAIRKAPCG